MKPLTQWVLRTALRQASEWRQQDLDVQMMVNLSARGLHDRQLVDMVGEVLADAAMPADRLGLEITEGAIMADPERAMEVLSMLADMGTCISIDDFGTGYSSLQYLDTLPARQLKIDRSFVRDIDESHSHRRIVHSTIMLGHELGLSVLAEGVERREAWDMLSELGCDTVQGYYLSKPLPADQFTSWAAAGAMA
jgi:EAL domain-containing protein (putative c-di-GMP-specific phosphodiesterase class I)